jgi:hypothetical protein
LVEEPIEVDDEVADLFLLLEVASSLPLEAPKLLDRCTTCVLASLKNH